MSYLIRFFLLLGVCVPVAVAGADDSTSEYGVKAAYLYNFLKLTAKPDVSSASSLQLCLRIPPELKPQFDPISGKLVQGRSTELRILESGADLHNCDLFFISKDFVSEVPLWLTRSVARPMLTIGESPDFCGRGGMLNFFLEDGTVHVELNAQAMQRAGIKVNSSLSALARPCSSTAPIKPS